MFWPVEEKKAWYPRKQSCERELRIYISKINEPKTLFEKRNRNCLLAWFAADSSQRWVRTLLAKAMVRALSLQCRILQNAPKLVCIDRSKVPFWTAQCSSRYAYQSNEKTVSMQASWCLQLQSFQFFRLGLRFAHHDYQSKFVYSLPQWI